MRSYTVKTPSFQWVWVIAIIFMIGCDSSYLDEGLLETDEGVPLCPLVLPQAVVCHSSCDEAEGDWLQGSINRWNEWLGVEVFRLVTENTYEEMEAEYRYGTVFVSVESIAGEDWEWDGSQDDANGTAHLAWDEDGSILTTMVIIDYEIAYHLPTVEVTADHELGHSLGFADDPGPPATVDLNSIMGSPTPLTGSLTDHDRNLWFDSCYHIDEGR